MSSSDDGFGISNVDRSRQGHFIRVFIHVYILTLFSRIYSGFSWFVFEKVLQDEIARDNHNAI